MPEYEKHQVKFGNNYLIEKSKKGLDEKMKIGIHFDKRYDMGHANKCKEFLQKSNVEVKELNLLAPDAMKQVLDCDGVVWRWEHNPDHKQSAQKILLAIEKCLRIPVFPNNYTAWHYDEKIYQYYVLQALGAPVPDTWLFWDYYEVLQWVEQASYPVVFKLSSGAGSSNVLKIDSKKKVISLINRLFNGGIYPYTMNEFKPIIVPKNLLHLKKLFNRYSDGLVYLITGRFPYLKSESWKSEKNYAYFQEFLPDNSYDTRITIIGDCAFGFRRMNRENDFRASGSGNLDYSPEKIDHSMVDIAFNVSKLGKFQSMSYDFLYKDGKPVICEISYTFSDEAVYNCPGHWNELMEWIPGQMWPEDKQMEVLMNQIREKI